MEELAVNPRALYGSDPPVLTACRGDPGGAGRHAAEGREWGENSRGEAAIYRSRERWGAMLTLGPWSGGVASAAGGGRRREVDGDDDDEHGNSEGFGFIL